MDKLIKTILIISIAIFGAGFLLALPANATEVDELIVEYSSDGGNSWLPLSAVIFSETNFLPGQDVTRLIRVTNNSEQTQRIAVESINENDLNNFASQLNLTIKEGATIIFDNTLSQFFSQGETYLSSLAGGNQTQYDFTIAFNSGAGNDYQEKTLGFDILVGFEGTEGGLPLPTPGGGTNGGGGWLPPGLTIQNETTATTTETSATFIWATSYPASSQVIYGREGEKHTLDLTDTAGTPPKYGYERTTPESDISPKVTSHLVIVDGLTSGTKYYYRTVSHASLAIGEEHSFITLGEMVFVQPKEKEVAITPSSVSVPAEKPEQPTTEQPIEQPVAQTATQNSLVATIGGFLTLGTGSVWLGILVGLIILLTAAYFVVKVKTKTGR